MRLIQKKIKNIIKGMSVPAKASIVLALASILTNGINILMTPIFTRIMTTEQIGIVTTYTSWQSIISVCASLSLGTGSFSIAMQQFGSRRDAYESSALFLSTLSSLTIFVIYMFLFPTINRIIGLSYPLMLLMIAGFFLKPATTFWIARQRYEFKYKASTIVTVFSSLSAACFSVIAVSYFNSIGISDTATARLFASEGIMLSFSLYIYIYIMKNGRTLVSKQYWKFALTLSLPLVIHSLSKQILDVSDRTMIASMVGLSAVGIYGTLYTISSLALIVWNAINASLVPYMFEKLKDRKFKDINNVIKVMLLAYSFLCIFVALVAPEIVRILATSEYYNAVYMMPPVVAGIFFTAVYNIFSNVLLYQKKTKYIMIATVIAAVVNILLNYIYIPRYGYIAASYSTLLSYILLAIAQYIMMNMNVREKIFDDKYILLISIITVVGCLIANILYYTYIIRYVIIIIIMMIVILYHKRILMMVKTVK